MDDVLKCILGYIHWVSCDPAMSGLTPLGLVTALRERLDEMCPGWRDVVRCENPDGDSALEVEIVLTSRRHVCGALTQRASAVPVGEPPV